MSLESDYLDLVELYMDDYFPEDTNLMEAAYMFETGRMILKEDQE